MSSENQANQAGVKLKHHYEQLVMRDFHSTIPPHLLSNLPEDERFMVETMSKLENQSGWQAESLLRLSTAILDLDDRVSGVEITADTFADYVVDIKDQKVRVEKLWEWKLIFSGKWGVVACLALIVIPVFLKFILDMVVKWFKT